VSAAAAFTGFLPQIIEHLGPVQWVEEPTAHGANRGYAVLYLRAPGGEIGSAVTSGLRFQNITAVLPQELCCSLPAAQEQTAHTLVAQVARMVLDGRAGLVRGTIIPGDVPLAEHSAMTGVICADHPYAGEAFDIVRDADGTIEMQIITLIPASPAELDLATNLGAEALFEIWHEQQTDLSDLGRPSAV
jgi:hypothetical protein